MKKKVDFFEMARELARNALLVARNKVNSIEAQGQSGAGDLVGDELISRNAAIDEIDTVMSFIEKYKPPKHGKN